MKKLAKIPINLILKILYEICDIYCDWYDKKYFPEPIIINSTNSRVDSTNSRE